MCCLVNVKTSTCLPCSAPLFLCIWKCQFEAGTSDTGLDLSLPQDKSISKVQPTLGSQRCQIARLVGGPLPHIGRGIYISNLCACKSGPVAVSASVCVLCACVFCVRVCLAVSRHVLTVTAVIDLD